MNIFCDNVEIKQHKVDLSFERDCTNAKTVRKVLKYWKVKYIKERLVGGVMQIMLTVFSVKQDVDLRQRSQ